MRRGLVFAALLWLGGCSLSDSISSGSMDYDSALEDVSNAMLVSNILRARDGAPLHFTDLSQIRGSLQVQLQAQASAPIGAQYVSSTRTRAAIQSTIGVSTSPSFDVVPLNTKEFTEGITTPMTMQTLGYYLDRGPIGLKADLLKIFVERIDLIDNYAKDQVECDFYDRPNKTVRIPDPANAPKPSCDDRARQDFQLDVPAGQIVNFQDILVQLAQRLVQTSYQNYAPFGPPLRVTDSAFLKEAGSLAASGLEVRTASQGGMIQLYRKTKASAICLEPKPGSPPGHEGWLILQSGRLGEPVTRTPPRESPEQVCEFGESGLHGHTERSSPTPQVVLYLRSVESAIVYLGRMLNGPEASRALPFYIRTVDNGHTRFRVSYRGTEYYVADNEGRKDATLLILSIINQILNLYKNANEIPTTKAVQSVP